MIHYHPHCIPGRVEQLFPDKKAPLAQLAEQVTLNEDSYEEKAMMLLNTLPINRAADI